MRTKRKPESDPPYQRPISLKQLAKHLELSPTTLSLVLNNSAGADSIPQATKDRILAAAREYNYRPNFLARSLRAQRTYTIGVLVPEFSDGYASSVLSGIADGLQKAGYIYLVSAHRHNPQLAERHPWLMYERRAEGLIAIDTPTEHQFPLPVISISSHRHIQGVTNIVVNHDRAAELALEHLKELGHREIAFIKGPVHTSDSEVRWQSIRNVAHNLGLQADESRMAEIRDDARQPHCGYHAVKALLERKVRFTALFTFNDIAAIGAVRALRDAGLRVPEDVSVVGFDDIPAVQYLNPALTTIRQPMARMGQLAAETIVRRITNPTEPIVEELQVEPELVKRESTTKAPAVAAEPAAAKK